MVDKDIFASNIVELIDYGYFSIKRIDYDEKSFGNFCIELVSSTHVGVRFIRDRGTFWCEAGKNGEWYFIEDVLSLIGIDTIDKKSDVSEFLKYMSKLITSNIPEIFNAFNAKNFKETQIKIKRLAIERALKMFKN